MLIPVSIEIVLAWSTSVYWGEAEGCTVVLQSGTISVPMGKHIDNDLLPPLPTFKIKIDF